MRIFGIEIEGVCEKWLQRSRIDSDRKQEGVVVDVKWATGGRVVVASSTSLENSNCSYKKRRKCALVELSSFK